MTGMSAHESAAVLKDEWLTPPEILAELGAFDLDPCSPIERPWDTANTHYTALDNGLNKPWSGRVWCNPPYGPLAAKWLARCADHGNAIALIFARTETAAFFEHVWGQADALFFFRGRLCFYHANGIKAKSNAGAPSVLVAYGEENAKVLSECGIQGYYVPLADGQERF